MAYRYDGTWCGDTIYATNQTSTYRHTILRQSPGKIRKNIRFGSTITNRLDNEGSENTSAWIQIVIPLSIFPGEWEGVCFFLRLYSGKRGIISLLSMSSYN